MAKHKATIHYEDPSVAHVAKLIAEEARAKIEARIIGDRERWFLARETVLEAEVKVWLKAYGKPTADMAVRLVHQFNPEGDLISKAGRKVQEREFEDKMIALMKRRGRYNWINRCCMAITGMPLYLAVAVCVMTACHVPPAEASTARQRHLSACAHEKDPDERHRLGCWRFGPSEMMLYREHDDDVHEWERPRSWEVE